MITKQVIVREGTYNMMPVIVLEGVGDDGMGYWLRIGVTKAKAIVENIDKIKTFVDKHDSGVVTEPGKNAV